MSAPQAKTIYCCGCVCEVQARLTDGAEIYPHREDLWALPFWKCDTCENNVGCHYKTKDPTRPLGVIATPAIKRCRSAVHRVLDPLWQRHGLDRKAVYRTLSDVMGFRYHTAKIKSEQEGRDVYRAVRAIYEANDLPFGT